MITCGGHSAAEVQVSKTLRDNETLTREPGTDAGELLGRKGRLWAREPWGLRTHWVDLNCTLEPDEVRFRSLKIVQSSLL